MKFDFSRLLNCFVQQSLSGDLKTATYPKEWGPFHLRISFGMGAPARVPWIAFVSTEMKVSNGFYPVYLYYKELNTLVLAYGISETEDFGETWPVEIINSRQTITSFFDKKVPRYGDSFVFKAYSVNVKEEQIEYRNKGQDTVLTEQDLEADLTTILNYYQKTILSEPMTKIAATQSQGLFYMEKQLEDFIIHNWDSTELGKRFDLIIEEGDLLSQQYRTDIGPIDILVRNKLTKNHVVIELKKNQTSDDTVGQVARYMGWIRENKNDPDVMGIIIAGEYDKKLDYALKAVPNVEVYLYKVDFKLKEFIK